MSDSQAMEPVEDGRTDSWLMGHVSAPGGGKKLDIIHSTSY
jgi:hypothetical protein